MRNVDISETVNASIVAKNLFSHSGSNLEILEISGRLKFLLRRNMQCVTMCTVEAHCSKTVLKCCSGCCCGCSWGSCGCCACGFG